MNEAIIPIVANVTGQFTGSFRATKDHKVKMVVYPALNSRASDYSGRVKPNPENSQELILELWWSGDNDYIIAMVYLNTQLDRYRVVANTTAPLPDVNMVVEYNFAKGKN